MPSQLATLRIVDEVLTNIARGYTNASFVGTSLFPVVEVTKEGGKIPQFTAEAFKIYNTERAIRSKSNRISPEGRTTIDYVLTEHDLEYPMDYREVEEDVANLELHASMVAADGIQLRLEKLIADQAQNLANFPTGNKVTLSSGDKFTNISSDPIAVFDTAKNAVRSKIAKEPNVCVLGASAFQALKNHPLILDRIKFTQHAIVTEELLRVLLQFDQLFVGKAVYISDAGIFTDLWADNVVLAFVPQTQQNVARNIYEPSFAYTLRKKGNPFVDKYDEGGKIHLVRATDNFVSKIVGSEAGYLINDTNI
ncbi:MAG: major capsid protein [Bacteroidetes bacterium]|nr:major capsid protein [Bacteroidota bacterium]